eukprot:542402-Pelagomonas_calceolata.AAC.1
MVFVSELRGGWWLRLGKHRIQRAGGDLEGVYDDKYCEDTRPRQFIDSQLDAAKQQHAGLCKLISAKAVTIHPSFLGVGETIYTEHTMKQFKQQGLDHQRATKLAQQLHAHSV